MNDRSTTPASSRTAVLTILMILVCSMLLVVSAHMAGATQPSVVSRIDELTEKIDELTAANERNGDQSDGIKRKIAELKRQRLLLEGKLAATTIDLEKITKDVASLSAKLDTRREALGSIIADQTIHGSYSTLEILMSSKSVGEYFNKAAYQASLERSLNQSVSEVKRLSQELKRKQAVVKQQQQSQQRDLANLKTDQVATEDSLVVLDGAGAHMTKLTAKLAAEKQRLQSQQQSQIQNLMIGAEQVSPGTLEAEIAPIVKKPSAPKPAAPAQPTTPAPSAPATPSPAPKPAPTPAPSPAPSKPTILPNGGYPAYLNNCFVDRNALSYGIDPWGYGCRQCVSYTAWKVLQKSGRAAMYWGNAKQWPASAQKRGYTVSSKPRAGSVGVMTSGPYGHVVWVESVNSNGTLNISQYNYWLPNKANGGWGYYSEFKNVSAGTYQSYVYI